MALRPSNIGRHPHDERGLDLYETPPEATLALLKHEKLPKIIYEPACGPGSIVRVLEQAGHIVMAADIRDYGIDQDVEDFLKVSSTDVKCIVTNPPYQRAEAFVRHAIKLCPHVVMLLRFAFLESERRTSILENAGLTRVLLFRKRLPMMHRAGWVGRRATSFIPFAWFVWRRGYFGLPTVQRISWEAIDDTAGKGDHGSACAQGTTRAAKAVASEADRRHRQARQTAGQAARGRKRA